MRILLVNHGTAGEWGGGDGVQIRETAKRLAKRGHHVEAINADKPDVRGFDIVHLFNCRVEDSFKQQMACCKQANVPVVVSPIWISLAKAIWGSRGTISVLQQVTDNIPPGKAEILLNQLRTRELEVRLPTGEVNAEGYGKQCWPINKNIIKELLLQADVCQTVGWSYRLSGTIFTGTENNLKSHITVLTQVIFRSRPRTVSSGNRISTPSFFKLGELNRKIRRCSAALARQVCQLS